MTITGQGLDALNARVRQDLDYLNYPPKNWVKPVADVDGKPVSDVVIVGGGMCGLVAWLALTRAGISNIRIIDKAKKGLEGPWLTFARMETLRSPINLTGPALGMASLTFQAWYKAQFSEADWNALYRIPRPMWQDYLIWYRDVLGIPVENDMDVKTVTPRADGLLALDMADGSTIITRKLVWATGRDGLGKERVPDFVDGLPRGTCWAHSEDAIDFDALKGKRIVVIGVGASAMDNAAEALEHGAGEVRLLARRKTMPTINKLMGIGSYGVTAGFPKLDAEWRWRLMSYGERQQTPAPHGSTLRVSRHDNAFFHFNCPIASVEKSGDEIVVTTTAGRVFRCDFLITATGFLVDPLAREEFAGFADRIACWDDHFTPPKDEESDGLGRFPWLAEDFAFTPKNQGDAAFLSDIHCFNYGSALSLGKVSGDIPAISEGATWLAKGLAASFFAKDLDQYWQELLVYEKPELDGSEWCDADAVQEA
ncbi:NAD(P)/FAD-dependent oxidoreductase [Martelella alba]|uniref:NAD(P)/FAD-dependent oxidoreductase n=1 Tax=Martelella alba TaxID=2590451 RepID=A0A506UBE3_9HYPH|nr:NAD(P)/FAD-dependent oxidoreductase [Martelella alba]TPW29117.1 NAD(P)/FAD-dependent oxidoreductase [Martelella alba]